MALEASLALARALAQLRGDKPADPLQAVQVGQTLDATVLAKLDSGEIRLSLAGTLLDIVSPESLDIGEPLKLTVVDKSGQLAVSIERTQQRPGNLSSSAPLARAAPLPVSTQIAGSAPVPRRDLSILLQTLEVGKASPPPLPDSSALGLASVVPGRPLVPGRALPTVASPTAEPSPTVASTPTLGPTPPTSAPATMPISAQTAAPVPTMSAASVAVPPLSTPATPLPAPSIVPGLPHGEEPVLPSMPVAAAAAAASPPAQSLPLGSPPDAAIPAPARPNAVEPPLLPATEGEPGQRVSVAATPGSEGKAPPVRAEAPLQAAKATPSLSLIASTPSPQRTPQLPQLGASVPAPAEAPAVAPPLVSQAVISAEAEQVDAALPGVPDTAGTTAPPITAPGTAAKLATPLPSMPAMPDGAAAPERSVPTGSPVEPQAGRLPTAVSSGLEEAPRGLSLQAREALQEMVPKAVAGQQGRAQLVANAAAVLAGPAAASLPHAVRQALGALVAGALDPTSLTAPALQQAVAESGIFQESVLLRASPISRADRPPTIKLLPEGADADESRQVTTAALVQPSVLPPVPLSDADAATLRTDAKSILLALHSALQLLNGDDVASPAPVLSRPPPPRPDAVPSGQPAAAAQPGIESSAKEAARALQSDAAGALDRVRLLQAASLPDNPRPVDPAQRFDRMMEIPLMLPSGQMPVMSLAIGRDGKAAKTPEQVPTWRMRLSLDIAPSGQMHALVALRGSKAAITLWAEKPETAGAFRSGLGELRDALAMVDLDVEALDVQTGVPPGATQGPARKTLDFRS